MKYTMNKMINGVEQQLGPDAHLGYEKWNTVDQDRAYKFSATDIAASKNRKYEVDITDAYFVPYIDLRYITNHEIFDVLVESAGLINSANDELLKYRILNHAWHFLGCEYGKGRYVNDEFGDRIDNYSEINLEVKQFDDKCTLYVTRKKYEDDL